MPVDLCQLCAKHRMVDTCHDGTCRDFSEFTPDPETEGPRSPLAMANFKGLTGNGRLALMLYLIVSVEHADSMSEAGCDSR